MGIASVRSDVNKYGSKDLFSLCLSSRHRPIFLTSGSAMPIYDIWTLRRRGLGILRSEALQERGNHFREPVNPNHRHPQPATLSMGKRE
jgi:hypothetical protein